MSPFVPSALDLGVARQGFLPDGPTFGFTPNTNAATLLGLPNQEATALGNMAQNQGPPDGVSRSAPPSPTATLTALAAAGRSPTDLTIPTVGSQAGGSGGDSPDTAGTTVTAASGGITADGTGSGGGGDGTSSGSHEQGWVAWAMGGVGSALRKADQLGGAAASFVLTGSANTGDSGSLVGIIWEGDKGVLQGGANVGNSVTDAGVGTVNLVPGVYNNTVAYVPGVRALPYIQPPEWSQGLVTHNGAPIETPETHGHSRFFGNIAVAAGSAALGPQIPFGKLPLPGPTAQLATNAGGTVIATTGELSLGAAPVGIVGTLGSINQMARGKPGGNAPKEVPVPSGPRIVRGSPDLDVGPLQHYTWESPSGQKFDLMLDVETQGERLVIRRADIMPESGTFDAAKGSQGFSGIRQLQRDLGAAFGATEIEILAPLERTTGAIGFFGRPGVYKIPR